MNTQTQFTNLIELQKQFRDEDTCWKYLEKLRWTETKGNPICPFCSSNKFYELKRKFNYRCANSDCRKTYNVKTGSIFENTKIPLRTWFIAIYVETSHKKGISSLQLHRDLGITQKTAWFILHRVREMLKSKAPHMLNSTVEIDETYVGGKERFKHTRQRKDLKEGRGCVNKTMVFSILDRNSGVYSQVVNNVDGETLKPIIRTAVDKSTVIVTDGFGAYQGLNKDYRHEVVNHAQDEWVCGQFHTNSVEGFFGLLKRGIIGIYHYVSPKHLHRYCNEFGFRYNTRTQAEAERFDNALSQCDKRLKYTDLIKKTV